MEIYKPEPNPYPAIREGKLKLISRYHKYPLYKKLFWIIIFLIVIISIFLQILIIPNIN